MIAGCERGRKAEGNVIDARDEALSNPAPGDMGALSALTHDLFDLNWNDLSKESKWAVRLASDFQ